MAVFSTMRPLFQVVEVSLLPLLCHQSHAKPQESAHLLVYIHEMRQVWWTGLWWIAIVYCYPRWKRGNQSDCSLGCVLPMPLAAPLT